MANILGLSDSAYDTLSKMYTYLTTKKGLSPLAASAILGNVMLESTFNHNAVSSKGAAGVYQLLGNKYKRYLDFLKSGWKDGPLSLTEFVINEILNGRDYYYEDYDRLKHKQANNWNEPTKDGKGIYHNTNDSIYFMKTYFPREQAGTLFPRREELVKALNTSRNIPTITQLFADYWERPSEEEKMLDQRIKYSNEIYNHFNPSKKKFGGNLNYLNIFKSGSSIHIKKENRGAFTDFCNGKVTEECIQRGKNSSNPTTRKRATFAENARHWKHLNGGLIQYGKIGLEIDPKYMFVNTSYNPYRAESNYENYMDYFTGSKSSDTTSTTTVTPSESTSSTIWDGYIPSGSSRSSGMASTKYADKAKFVTDLTQAYTAMGYNPELVKLMVAQDALETGWGKSVVGDYNFGNIKTGANWSGNSRSAHDKREGSYDAYRSYDSLEQYVKDKTRLLSSSYDITPGDSASSAISKLTGNNSGKRKYATSKNYAESLTRVFNSI